MKKILYGIALGILLVVSLAAHSFASLGPPAGPPPPPPVSSAPPTVSIVSPANTQTVSSTVVISGVASDTVSLTSVAISIDGASYVNVSGTTSWTYSWNTKAVANGSHTLEAQATDSAGNTGVSVIITVTVSNGSSLTPPSTPTGLTTGTVTTSTINFSWNASVAGTNPIAGYKIYRCTGTCSPSTQIGTTTATSFTDVGLNQSTTYSFAVSAYDSAGNNSGNSNSVQATTKFQDTTAPTVSVTNPVSGATVSSTVTLAATANDNVAVASVQFRIDGTLVGSPITTAPYTYAWDSRTASNNSHSVTALAKDTSNNQTISAPVTITVANNSSGDTQPPTVPTNLAVTGSTTSTISLGWTASVDNVGVAGYNVFRNGTQVGTPTTNTYTDTALAASTTYSYTVSTFDAAGNNSSQSSPVSGTTLPTGDITPPSVAITNPVNNQSVAGTITVMGGGFDNVGLANIQISIDGGAYNAANGTSSWTYTFNTAQLANGNHTIMAKATDSVGNTNSTAITINVNNQTNGTGGTGTGSGSGSGSGGTGSGGTTTPPSLPTSTSSLEALLQSLILQLNSLIVQENALIVPHFTRNLTIGSIGTDVAYLQEFLDFNGFPVSTSGFGSLGDEVTYFGPKTSAALAKFQAANKLPATGFLGPLTRAFMQRKW